MATLELEGELKGQLRGLQLSLVTRTGRKEPIGSGAYGSVLEVMVNQTVFAAKEMWPVIDLSPTAKSSFLSECVRCSKILHPNVVQFLGIYYPNPEAKLPWLVMEMMHTSLTKLIEKYQSTDFPLHFKLSILMDVCQGLQFLHSQNLIHRDLTSNNILLTKHLAAKIGDFGVAKVIPPGTGKHTLAPVTPVFMSPEALSTANPVYGAPLDVFSFGCVCVHAVSLQWPIPLDKFAENVVLSEVQRREHLCAKMVDYPKLKSIVEKCLQDEPGDRPVIGEVINNLTLVDYTHLPHENDDIIDLFNTTVSQEQDLAECRKKVQHLSEKDEEISQLNQQLNESLQRLQQNNDERVSQLISLQHKDVQIAKRDEQLKEKDKKLNHQDQMILQNKKQLSNQEQMLATKTDQLFQKDQMLRNKDNDLEQKDMELSLRNQQLQRKDLDILQKNEELQSRNEELVQKDHKLRQTQKEGLRKIQELQQNYHGELLKKDKNFNEEIIQKNAQISELREKLDQKDELLVKMDELFVQNEENELKNSRQFKEELFQRSQQLRQHEFDLQLKDTKINQLEKEMQKIKGLLLKFVEDERKDLYTDQERSLLNELYSQSKSVSLQKPSISDPFQWYVELLITWKESIPYKFPTDEHGPKVVGFNNLGNTCFFNSMLQSIHQTLGLHYVMAKKKKIYEIPETKLGRMEVAVSGKVSTELHNFFSGVSKQSSSISPRNLLHSLGRINKRFGRGSQEDSHEVMRCLLSALREEEIKCIKDQIKSRFTSSSDGPLDGESQLIMKGCLSKASKGVCEVDQLIGTLLLTTTICHHCHNPLEIEELCLDLSLPMPVTITQNNGSRNQWPKTSSMQKQGAKEVSCEDSTPGSTSGPGSVGDDNGIVIDTNSAYEELKKDKSVPFSKSKFNRFLELSNLHHSRYFQEPDKFSTQLEQCLADFTDLDVLDENNKFICQECSTDENLEITERRVSKQMLIHQLPPVLILHMKRFSIGRTVTKDNQHVSFSPVLNMVPFCTTECVQRMADKENKILYGLYAVVVHGGSLHGGHYTANVRRRQPVHEQVQTPKGDSWKYDERAAHQGDWYHISDSYVSSRSTFSSVVGSQAYLLFYELLPITN
ncbi:serine/threonine-protein kinase TAO3-like isoform X2 [Dysidea avara]|uniref:serine/threonine-protein kinase TAO3-like isoform X2 n=1 Tax=Dysidea avara TaxID=196820 RepID=UPI003321F777